MIITDSSSSMSHYSAARWSQHIIKGRDHLGLIYFIIYLFIMYLQICCLPTFRETIDKYLLILYRVAGNRLTDINNRGSLP